MNWVIKRSILITLLFLSGDLYADTRSASLDRPRGYDVQSNAFIDNLFQQNTVDGSGQFDAASGEAASASYQGIYYTAITREVAGTTTTHIFLLRNDGTKFEGWDHDSKSWMTGLGNMDPIDSEISQGYTAANPAMAIDSKGNVYVAYTRTVAAGVDRKVFMSKYDVEANDVFIWDDGATELTNDLSAPDQSTDSISNNASASTIDADNVAPAIAIDSNDDVYIAYSIEMSAGADAKIFLSKFDASEEDAYIWDDGASWMTNNLRAPASELDSFSVNQANFETSTSPVLAIDNNDLVYMSFLQEGIAGANNRIWLTMFDPDPEFPPHASHPAGVIGGDAFIWNDGFNGGVTSFTNNLQTPDDELDSVGNNQSNNNDASGSPAMAIDSNNNVYISYIQQSEDNADPKIWLSRYDPAARLSVGPGDAGGDVFIWDDRAIRMTNNLSAPDDELDSFGVNAVTASDASGVPAMVIDKQDNVWVSYVQQTSGPANPHVWLSMYDPNARASAGVGDAGGDVFIWDDATSMLTNDLTAPGSQSGISWNQSADADAFGSPTMALAENGDIYIAYANDAVASSGNPHVNVSFLDVSEQDVYVWHDGISDWTNDLQAPNTFTDSLDNSSADGDISYAPVMTATSSGIYINYLARPDGTNDHTHVVRIGTPNQDIVNTITQTLFNLTSMSFDIDLTTGIEKYNLYAVCVEGSDVPTATDIKAGRKNSSDAAEGASSILAGNGGSQTLSCGSLMSSTSYTVYTVIERGADLFSAVTSQAGMATLDVINSITQTTRVPNAVSFEISIVTSGEDYNLYSVCAIGAGIPSAADIKAGRKNGTDAAEGFDSALSASGVTQTLSCNNLTPDTSYTVYTVIEKGLDQFSEVISQSSITTNNDNLCFPIKAKSGAVAVICL